MNRSITLFANLLFFLFFTTLAIAQTTIDSSDFEYMFERETNIYTYMDTSTSMVDIGTTGGDNMWDFSSGLSIDRSFTFDVINPAGTPYRPDYPDAHVAYKYFLSDSMAMESWEYYCRSSNLVHLHGMVDASPTDPGQVTKYMYDPIKIFAKVPMTMGTTWRDSVTEKVVTETNGTVRGEQDYALVTEAMVDAYGTIILPDTSMAEALRVKITENRTLNGATETRVFFRWFAKTGETLVIETDPDSPDSGEVNASNIKWTLKSEIVSDVPVQTALLPDNYSLNQNYPNPFNPTTNIKYTIPEEALVQVKVYNMIGKEIATLVNARRPAGTYIANFDGNGLASGIYFVKMTAGRFNQVIKMTLLK